MSYPKHFLADVPQELRRQLLDLCFRQRRHEALNLLREKGFNHYDDLDLQAFYGWAPTNLPEAPAPTPHTDAGHPPSSSIGISPPFSPPGLERPGDPPISSVEDQSPCIEQAPSTAEPSLVDTEADAPDATAPKVVEDSRPCDLATPPPDIPVKRRGKVARLPKEMRNQVNLFIDDGKTFEEIAQWLEEKGFPGFNAVNLHNWKIGGFQEWLREQERLESQQLQREWIADLARHSAPGEFNQLSLQLFSSQIMDTLFGMDTSALKKGLGSNPRHYIALLNSVCRMNEHFMDSEEYQAFARNHRQRQNRKRSGLTDETRQMIMDELRIVLRHPAPEPSDREQGNLKSKTPV